MRLHYAPYSPYARKVRVVAAEHGHELELVDTDTWAIPASLYAVNPLGKVPALSVSSGQMMYDSRVICEYLDSLNDGCSLFPVEPRARWRALTLQALGDGIMDAAVAAFVEEHRPTSSQDEDWRVRQLGSIDRSLDVLQRDIGSVPEFCVGCISVAVAISYLLFRFGSIHWLDKRTVLQSWYEEMEQRPSFATTRLADR